MNGNYVTYGYYQGAMVVTAIHHGGENWEILYRPVTKIIKGKKRTVLVRA